MNEIAKIQPHNIERIPLDKFEKDFSFIVNGKRYKTNLFVANMLSPHISKMLEENINFSFYEINTKFEGDFNRIIEYGKMKAIPMNEKENIYFRNVLVQLGNKNEAIRFSKELQQDFISFENVIQRINTKKELEIDFDEEIAYISNNFHKFLTKLPQSILSLDVDIIERIISKDELKIHKEEELFNIILQLYTKSKEYSALFSYVIFMNLPNESIQNFIETFDINDINKSIWEKICSRLEQKISTKSKIAYQESRKDFFNKRYIYKRYEHIIEHLNKQYNGNVHMKDIVHITSSTIYSNWGVENVVEDNNKHFGTKNEASSWIQFDFKKRRVLLDHYTLKTIDYPENANHLKSWILEVSNDGQHYNEIDHHENCDLLNGNLRTATFNVLCSTPQRFIRLKQTGENWKGNNTLKIANIDFSGILYE